MSTHPIEGEMHTPAAQLTSVSIILYRWTGSGCEIFVRSRTGEDNPTYSVPFRVVNPGESALQCAQRIGTESLSINLLEEDLDYEQSAVISNLGEEVATRAFMIQVTRRSQTVSSGAWRGWQYQFLPLSSIDVLYLHPSIKATGAALRTLVGPSPRMSWIARQVYGAS
ncbi:hypothetical protein NPX13_g1801 [Xylaria arbuscula]|uniref:Uncharacterized protein n=1 Tax=Xylaria arbuscula TaxID=114810 RepID=A0A9W8TQZ2_9PEZI|nr:hypothetical protein NPX13_g1801 [Xylaria arbuscula]